MDIRMGASDGIEACRDIKSAYPETAVLMLTSFGTDEAVIAALVAGASGFLLKNTGRAELLRAVRAVGNGESLLDPAVTGRVTAKLVELVQRDVHPEIAEISP